MEFVVNSQSDDDLHKKALKRNYIRRKSEDIRSSRKIVRNNSNNEDISPKVSVILNGEELLVVRN